MRPSKATVMMARLPRSIHVSHTLPEALARTLIGRLYGDGRRRTAANQGTRRRTMDQTAVDSDPDFGLGMIVLTWLAAEALT